jgi:hypothetical protein
MELSILTSGFLLQFKLKRYPFLVYDCCTSRSQLKDFLAFCCGGYWDRLLKCYQFPSKCSLLHFGFLTGDLDRLYLLKFLDEYRFENQLEAVKDDDDAIPF